MRARACSEQARRATGAAARPDRVRPARATTTRPRSSTPAGRRPGAAAARGRARRGRPRPGASPPGSTTSTALQAALAADPTTPTAAALLGHWLYAHGRRRRRDRRVARARRARPERPGGLAQPRVARFNHRAATRAAARRVRAGPRTSRPADPRLSTRRDQLPKRTGGAVEQRLARLEAARGRSPTVTTSPSSSRTCWSPPTGPMRPLRLLAGAPVPAVGGRRGPGAAGLGAHAARARRAGPATGDGAAALGHARAALDPPDPWVRPGTRSPTRLSCCWRSATPAQAAATRRWRGSTAGDAAAESVGDFTEMAPRAYSEKTYYSVLAARRLGDAPLARRWSRAWPRTLGQLAATPGAGRLLRHLARPRCCCSRTTRSAGRT